MRGEARWGGARGDDFYRRALEREVGCQNVLLQEVDAAGVDFAEVREDGENCGLGGGVAGGTGGAEGGFELGWAVSFAGPAGRLMVGIGDGIGEVHCKP